MPGIPSDQWIKEVITLKQYLMSAIQIAFTDYAIGLETHAPNITSIIEKPSTDGEKALCQAQKMKKSRGFALVFHSTTPMHYSLTIQRIATSTFLASSS